MKKSNELTIIIGCGRLGSAIANELSNSGASVIVIDRKQEAFKKLSSSFGGISKVGNGCDIETLKENKADEATNLIAVTDFDNNNIFTGLLAANLFKIKNVIIRVDDSEKTVILKDTNIKTINPYDLSSQGLIDLIRG